MIAQFERRRTFCLFGCLRLIRSIQICCCRRNGRRSKLTTRLQSWRTFWQENAGSSSKQSIGQTIKNSFNFVQKAHGGFSIIFVNCREGRRIWMYPGIDRQLHYWLTICGAFLVWQILLEANTNNNHIMRRAGLPILQSSCRLVYPGQCPVGILQSDYKCCDDKFLHFVTFQDTL